jgi:DNA-binding NarL/FixJ family response regulator
MNTSRKAVSSSTCSGFGQTGTAADVTKRSIAIVDDSRDFSRQLGEFIQEQPDLELVGQFFTGAEVRRKLPGLNPAIILLDIQLPDMTGLELLPDIHTMAPLAEIIMLTSFDQPGVVTEAVHLGVSGFILKRSGLVEILAAIRKVARGDGAVDEGVAMTILREFRRREQPLCVLPKLSPQETKLLEFLSSGSSLRQAAHLSGITYQTGRFYLQNTYRKLQVNTMTQAVLMFLRGTRSTRPPSP